MPNVTVITVTRGTSVTVFFAFSKPTRASYPTIKIVATTPVSVTFSWRPAGGTETTWTYGVGTHITRLGTGVYVATISTKTVTTTAIEGKVVGTGDCTATGQFAIQVNPTQL